MYVNIKIIPQQFLIPYILLKSYSTYTCSIECHELAGPGILQQDRNKTIELHCSIFYRPHFWRDHSFENRCSETWCPLSIWGEVLKGPPWLCPLCMVLGTPSPVVRISGYSLFLCSRLTQPLFSFVGCMLGVLLWPISYLTLLFISYIVDTFLFLLSLLIFESYVGNIRN